MTVVGGFEELNKIINKQFEHYMKKDIINTLKVVEGMEMNLKAMVKLKDYLSVVEEKSTLEHCNFNLNERVEELEKQLEIKNSNFEKVFESKNRTIGKLKEELEDMYKDRDYFQSENEKLQGDLVSLNNMINDMFHYIHYQKEDTYTLIYGYYDEKTNMVKEYKQTGLLKDEYEIMYGMDSDNWLWHSLVKE